MQYQMDFGFLAAYRAVLWEGLLNTVMLSAAIALLGLLIGVVIVECRLSARRALRVFGLLYVNLLRNLPALIVLFWFFYAIPIFTQIQNDRLLTAVAAFSLYSGAYFCEILRGSINKIDKGQWDAAFALGFTRRRGFFTLILPQALRHALPSLTNEAIEVVKISSVAATVAYPELLYQAKLIGDSEYRPVETYTVVAFIIILFVLLLSAASYFIEHRYTDGGKRQRHD